MELQRTQLKLYESKEDGRLVGFVSCHNKSGRLFGVREDSYYGKQICVLDEGLQDRLKPNVLYEVFVTPMHSGAGYVIVKAKRVMFSARVETKIIANTLYIVTVTFGNKVVYFDPIGGRSESSSTIDGVVEVIRGREDIKNKESVIDDFIEAATNLMNQILLDGVQYSNIK